MDLGDFDEMIERDGKPVLWSLRPALPSRGDHRPDDAGTAGRVFVVDIRDRNDGIIVVADLPGAEKKDVSVSHVNPGILGIRSERRL